MTIRPLFLIIAFFTIIQQNLSGQHVTNVYFEKYASKINIYYDLKGKFGTRWNIDVFFSNDGGTTWGNSLQKLTGEFGRGIKPGDKRKIIWDVESEGVKSVANMAFKVEATQEKLMKNIISYNADYYKYRRNRNIWLFSAFSFGATGIFFKNRADQYYSEYLTSTSNAADLHQKVQLYDRIYPAALCLSGLCAVNAVISLLRQKKAKNLPLSFEPFQFNKGTGIKLSCNF